MTEPTQYENPDMQDTLFIIKVLHVTGQYSYLNGHRMAAARGEHAWTVTRKENREIFSELVDQDSSGPTADAMIIRNDLAVNDTPLGIAIPKNILCEEYPDYMKTAVVLLIQ